MADESCRHDWKIVNLRSGFYVTEGCTHCGKRASYFTLKEQYHQETYIEGEHRWRFIGSAQAVKFDLTCESCSKHVNLDEVMALMLCMDCKEDCKAAELARQQGNGEVIWIYLALCPDPSHMDKTCVPEDQTRALTEYFNSRIKTPGKKVAIVPCSMMESIDTCHGEIIADIGLKDLY